MANLISRDHAFKPRKGRFFFIFYFFFNTVVEKKRKAAKLTHNMLPATYTTMNPPTKNQTNEFTTISPDVQQNYKMMILAE